MSTAIWGESEAQSDASSSLSQLKRLLQEMMESFQAQGACLALYDENLRQMVVRLHLRAQPPQTMPDPLTPPPTPTDIDTIPTVPMGRRKTPPHGTPSLSASGRMRRLSRPLPSLESVASASSPSTRLLFPLGEAYTYGGQDLIGATWRKNEPVIVRNDAFFAANDLDGAARDALVSWLLAIPVADPPPLSEVSTSPMTMLGVIILYQTTPGPGFHEQQEEAALQFAERIGLYIQNDRLRRAHQRTHDYMKRLQQISTAFPSTVILSRLVQDVYEFVQAVVPISSLLLTFYDRDREKIYDVFAVNHGQPYSHLLEQPVVDTPAARPLWWKITQQEQHALRLSTSETENLSAYEELFKGTWGDQSSAESFLLLPMKMFTRIVGSLALTSARPDAFSSEDIMVLETMLQLVTVGIENAKLYENARVALKKAKQREESLATINSALQAVSNVLNQAELLHKFVEISAKLVHTEMCTFFRLSDDGTELIAQAIYDSTGKWRGAAQHREHERHGDLIELIRIPFASSVLYKLVEAGSFFYLDTDAIDELIAMSGEGGAIFLYEMRKHKMLMIPVRYQTGLVGLLAVHTPWQDRVFRPEEVGTLQAISGQAVSALRNAQLFEQIRDANVELKRMDKLKDEFIVTASHELRTPLSAISGYASLLRSKAGRLDSQQVLRYTTKIVEATQQLVGLVTNMTEAAQMGTLDRNLELQLGPVQLLTASQMAVTMVSISIEQQIELQIAPELWVKCDAQPLRQVLTNLLDNAAKYSPPDGQITVKASACRLSQLPEGQADYTRIANGDDPEVVLVRVCDEGEGIPLEDQEKIFEKFVRASRSLTTPVRGSGLGLYICRRYIEAMGGRLWLEMSIPGEGSIFTFYLPRIEEPVQARSEAVATSTPPTR